MKKLVEFFVLLMMLFAINANAQTKIVKYGVVYSNSSYTDAGNGRVATASSYVQSYNGVPSSGSYFNLTLPSGATYASTAVTAAATLVSDTTLTVSCKASGNYTSPSGVVTSMTGLFVFKTTSTQVTLGYTINPTYEPVESGMVCNDPFSYTAPIIEAYNNYSTCTINGTDTFSNGGVPAHTISAAFNLSSLFGLPTLNTLSINWDDGSSYVASELWAVWGGGSRDYTDVTTASSGVYTSALGVTTQITALIDVRVYSSSNDQRVIFTTFGPVVNLTGTYNSSDAVVTNSYHN